MLGVGTASADTSGVNGTITATSTPLAVVSGSLDLPDPGSLSSMVDAVLPFDDTVVALTNVVTGPDTVELEFSFDSSVGSGCSFGCTDGGNEGIVELGEGSTIPPCAVVAHSGLGHFVTVTLLLHPDPIFSVVAGFVNDSSHDGSNRRVFWLTASRGFKKRYGFLVALGV